MQTAEPATAGPPPPVPENEIDERLIKVSFVALPNPPPPPSALSPTVAATSSLTESSGLCRSSTAI